MWCSSGIWWWEASVHVFNRVFRFLHTLILSMLASTRSWSTSFCAWTTLLLLLHIFPDISCSMRTQKKKTLLYGLSILPRHQKEQQENDPERYVPWSKEAVQESLVREALNCTPFLFTVRGQFKGSVTWKVTQHRVGNVTNITHHFTATTDEKIIGYRYALCVFTVSVIIEVWGIY